MPKYCCPQGTSPQTHRSDFRPQPRVDKWHSIVQTCNLTYCPTVTFVTVAAASRRGVAGPPPSRFPTRRAGQVCSHKSQLRMLMESPPGLRVGDTQVHQRQHLTKIIGNRTIEGLHHGSASRAKEPFELPRLVQEIAAVHNKSIELRVDPPRFEDAGTVRRPMAAGQTVSGDEPIPCFEGGT